MHVSYILILFAYWQRGLSGKTFYVPDDNTYLWKRTSYLNTSKKNSRITIEEE